jgi:hypothetical protein
MKSFFKETIYYKVVEDFINEFGFLLIHYQGGKKIQNKRVSNTTMWISKYTMHI